jgi:uroporphyrinogen decarboxylase
VDEPVRELRDIARLGRLDPESDLPHALEAIGLVRAALTSEQALVGFVGGPFTVAGYLIEGRPSRSFTRTKKCMYGAPDVWHALMEQLTEAFAGYAAAQAKAGADVIQLFDSWAGALSVSDYREFVAPYSARILAAVGVPTIHFATGASHLLEEIAAAGGDVIGLDWRIDLDRGWEAVGPDRGVQGNLDPACLLGPFDRVAVEASAILDRAGGRPGHVFNLGHGVLPETDPGTLRRLRELVHERTERRVAA